MVDPVLVIGAVVAALGIAAFGFLYFVSNDADSEYDKQASARRELLGVKEPKGPKKEKKEKPKKVKPAKKSKTADGGAEGGGGAVAEPEPEQPVKTTPAAPTKKASEPEPVVVKAPAAKPTKPAKAGTVIPDGKLSDADAEDVIQTIVKRLNGRVPKGSKGLFYISFFHTHFQFKFRIGRFFLGHHKASATHQACFYETKKFRHLVALY